MKPWILISALVVACDPSTTNTELKDAGSPKDGSSPSCELATPVPWTEADHCNCLADPPTCGTDPCGSGLDWPTWEIASRMLPACIRSNALNPVHGMRCGSYNAVAVDPLDAPTVRFYDSTGKLVGLDHAGTSTLHCVAYEASFVSPIVNWSLTGCVEMETPICP
jgi:hypothetical protein